MISLDLSSYGGLPHRTVLDFDRVEEVKEEDTNLMAVLDLILLRFHF